MSRVLLTGARAPVSLELARHLRHEGCDITLADSVRLPSARWSRAVRRYIRLPRPIDGAREYVDALAEAVRRHRIDLVIPTCEEIYYVARHRERLPCEVLCADFAQLDALHNKERFPAFVNEHVNSPVLAPRTRRVCAEREYTHVELEQLVFKPVYSRFAAFTEVGPDQPRYEALQREPRAWVEQARIYGVEYSTYSVAREGKLLAHSCYHSKYRVDAGSGVLFSNVSSKKTRIIEFVRAFAEAANFNGQVGFDFIETADAMYVIECNPRATSGAHLFSFSDGLAGALLGRASALQIASGPDRKLAFAMPLVTEITRGQVRRWPSWLRDALRTPDAVFRWDDLVPSFASPLTVAEIVLTAVRRRRKLTEAATYDIEYDGQPL